MIRCAQPCTIVATPRGHASTKLCSSVAGLPRAPPEPRRSARLRGAGGRGRIGVRHRGTKASAGPGSAPRVEFDVETATDSSHDPHAPIEAASIAQSTRTSARRHRSHNPMSPLPFRARRVDRIASTVGERRSSMTTARSVRQARRPRAAQFRRVPHKARLPPNAAMNDIDDVLPPACETEISDRREARKMARAGRRLRRGRPPLQLPFILRGDIRPEQPPREFAGATLCAASAVRRVTPAVPPPRRYNDFASRVDGARGRTFGRRRTRCIAPAHRLGRQKRFSKRANRRSPCRIASQLRCAGVSIALRSTFCLCWRISRTSKRRPAYTRFLRSVAGIGNWSARRPKGNVSKTTAAGAIESNAASSRSRRRARNASSIGWPSASSNGLRLASAAWIDGSCTVRTLCGMRPPTGRPPHMRCTSNPSAANASAMNRARIR